MTLERYLALWLAITVLASLWVHGRARIDAHPPPSPEAGAWAISALEAARTGGPAPGPPQAARDYRAAGPVIVLAWWDGRVQARHVGGAGLVESVQTAADRFASLPELRALPGWAADATRPIRFTLSVTVGQGPLLEGIPLLSPLSVVPLLEGVSAELGDRTAHLTPDELWGLGLYDTAVRTPIPDLSFGMDLGFVRRRLAAALGVEEQALVEGGRLSRFRAASVLAAAYPSSERVSQDSLARAAREGAAFLLRHMRRDGRYSYYYDGATGRRERTPAYSLPRHSGTTYFLAQADRVLGMPKARLGALRAMSWLQRTKLASCGGEGLWCIRGHRGADMGSAALTALAAAELLKTADHVQTRELLDGLTAFIRSMQRPDGELMHEYDVQKQQPIDVQRMYFSGEAAYALLNAHRATADARNLETATRLMGHLTGGAWNFFGSRYFYGEEHWTCQAAAEAAGRIDVGPALDFCMRWLGFQRAVQFGPGQTPWAADGAYGVGPIVVPRLTAVASRVEAGAQIYRVARDRGLDVAPLRDQIERSLGMLMRMRWAPGPVHLMPDPAGALGGVPATQASLRIRNDFVQHAGSAMLLWLEVMREESAGATAR